MNESRSTESFPRQVIMATRNAIGRWWGISHRLTLGIKCSIFFQSWLNFACWRR